MRTIGTSKQQIILTEFGSVDDLDKIICCIKKSNNYACQQIMTSQPYPWVLGQPEVDLQTNEFQSFSFYKY